VTRFPDRKAIAHVRRRDQTQRPDECGRTVRQDISVQVRRDDDVVRRRLPEQLVHHRVDDLLLDSQVGVLGLRERRPRRLAEEAVRLAEDVALVRDGDERGLVDAGRAGVADLLSAQGDFARHARDAVRGALGDAFDGFGDLAAAVGGGVRLFFLDVEVLGVFAHDDEIDGRSGRGGRLDGADVGVEVEAFA